MEGFLQRSASIDSVADEEFLLSRYHNIDYIMSFDYEYGIDFIHQAYDKRLEDRLFQQWLAEIPHMQKRVSFEEYKKERLRPRIKIEKRFSKEEWLLKAQEIEEKTKRGGF
ncbi:hypothetical protein [Turicibacter sp. GALT-G1]|uniref:hypothetical protein n=1 Tax=Turicibacter sp. GALT-G1 TaxID=2951140 RepID=UPI0021D4C790|nr:hypothetical protein [Turicibacter sp. GALT-G1]MCU7205951.1 hypothetical protein [Turicibacter sp. GALT-G1]